MHYICLVVGESVDEQLAPFADSLEVEPYRVFLADDEIRQMSEHYGISVDDLAGLAAKLPDWQDADGGVENRRLYYWSRRNPTSKFDWYRIGGRFDGYLRPVVDAHS